MLTRAFGPFVITQDLAQDAFGTLHRAWEHGPGGEVRPRFLRVFAPDLGAGPNLKALRWEPLMGEPPAACGESPAFAAEPLAHWAVDWRHGHSLRRIQAKCREEGFPFELPLALHLGLTLAHTCARYWRQGLSVGSLSLDDVRLDFEGALFLPDLRWLPGLIREADRNPAVRERFPFIPQGPREGLLLEEASRFAACLFSLVTFEPPPADAQALARAQAWTPEGPRDLPAGLQAGLGRLMGFQEPFGTLEEALLFLEALVFADEDGPSTFHLAHLMHGLFRAELLEEQAMLEREAAALAQAPRLWEAPAEEAPVPPPAPASRRSPAGILGAVALALVVAGGAAVFMRRGRSPAAAATPAPLQPPPAAPEPRTAPAAPVAHPPAAEAQAAATPKAPDPKAEPSPEPVARTSLTAADLTGPDRAPKVWTRTQPAWPGGKPGKPIVVRVFVNEDGRPLRATPEPGSSASPAVLKAATEAAMRSAYLPAIREGKPARDWVEVPF